MHALRPTHTRATEGHSKQSVVVGRFQPTFFQTDERVSVSDEVRRRTEQPVRSTAEAEGGCAAHVPVRTRGDGAACRCGPPAAQSHGND